MNGGADLERRMIVNIGEQRFDKMIEEHKFYIDKTGFIKEWWEYGSTVTLITRPRRFGKHLICECLRVFSQISMRTEETFLKGFQSGRKKWIFLLLRRIRTGICKAQFQ